uniref:Integrase family protein n=1 Tax=Burkholderia sp. (strain CCGE1003) TaxID=640512 RepID=E1T7F8_BURSG
MPTISKRVNRAGEISYQAKCRRKGFPILSKTFVDKKEAIKWARGIERAWDTGEGLAAPAPVAQTTVGDVLRLYDTRCVPAHRGAADEHARIASFLKHSFSRVLVADLTPEILANYRDERLKRVKPGTVLRELNIIRAALISSRNVCQSSQVSPDIEAVYLYTRQQWKVRQDGKECSRGKSDREPFKERHFLTCPVRRLQKDGWAQIKISMIRTLATTLEGQELKDSYRLQGKIALRLSTSAGNFDHEFQLDVTVDEIPF